MNMAYITIGGKQIYTAHKLRTASALHGYGTTVKEYTTLKPTKAKCRGCQDNYYNGSNSMTGECWGFSSAKVVDKVGHSSIYVEYGPDVIMKKTHSCWHSVQK